MELSFDERVQMASDDPDAYENFRKKMIETFIDRADPRLQQRLKGMQFRIDMERRRSKVPLASCMRLFNMMMDHFYDEHVPIINRQVENLQACAAEKTRENGSEKILQKNVIPFLKAVE